MVRQEPLYLWQLCHMPEQRHALIQKIQGTSGTNRNFSLLPAAAKEIANDNIKTKFAAEQQQAAQNCMYLRAFITYSGSTQASILHTVNAYVLAGSRLFC